MIGRLHWHRLLERVWQHVAAAHFAAVWRHRERGGAAHDRALHHGKIVDRIKSEDRAREWDPRLWQRDGETRSETEERRP